MKMLNELRWPKWEKSNNGVNGNDNDKDASYLEKKKSRWLNKSENKKGAIK